jgi:acetyl esterase/lipase
MVPWIFLIVSIIGGLYTLVSFRPPKRPGWLMAVGFFAAWLTTELAPIFLVVQLLATIVFIALGALESWPGWVGLAISLVSWFWLAASVKGALQTDRVFARALQDTLGPDWDAHLDPLLGESAKHINWRRIALPFHFKRPGVVKHKNIQYMDNTRKRHRLDIYRLEDVREGAPVLLQIHGGAWMIGKKDEQGKPLMYHLAARGWVCVAINYRLSPRGTWPDHLVDCKRALAWIREHIAEYGGNPDYVVATGGSAGGHLTALMGLTANDPAFQPGFEDVDTSVRAMIPFYGVFDWTGASGQKRDTGLREIVEKYIIKQSYTEAQHVFEAASPMHRVHGGAPPALVIHGDLDTLAPVGEARAFVEKMRATSMKPVVYVELAGAHHAFELFNSIRAMHVIAGVDMFLAWLLTAEPAVPAQAPRAADPADTGARVDSAIDLKSTAHTEPRPELPTRAAPGRS